MDLLAIKHKQTQTTHKDLWPVQSRLYVAKMNNKCIFSSFINGKTKYVLPEYISVPVLAYFNLSQELESVHFYHYYFFFSTEREYLVAPLCVHP